jgi:hypothetical protein
MATSIEEFEQRLKNLEIEQDQQHVSLDHFNEFEEEIRKLENTLAQIDNYVLRQNEDDDFERKELEETKRIERELEQMEKEERLGVAPLPEKTENDSNTPNSVPPKGVPTYVICLMFNPKSPQEWSGKGWSEVGKGKRYTNLEQTKSIAQRLKKQWPDYPLKIFKR